MPVMEEMPQAVVSEGCTGVDAERLLVVCFGLFVVLFHSTCQSELGFSKPVRFTRLHTFVDTISRPSHTCILDYCRLVFVWSHPWSY